MMPLPMAKQEYLEVSTSVSKDFVVQVVNIDADLFIDIDSSYEEIVVHVIGPESCVKDISVDEGDKHRKVLKISRGWKEDAFFFRPIAVSGGNVYTRAIIRLKIPEGTLLNISKVRGFIRVNSSKSQVEISK
jgi:hypothetical protein